MLTRALERRQELGLRVALGAGRGRLVRQLLTECLVLSILGGALGIAFAWAALHPILAMIPTDRGIPRIGDARLDGIALAFAALASIVTGIVFGIAPAWRASRLQPGEVLKEGGRGGATGRRERRLGDAVVAVEIALTLPLLVAAVLLVRSFTLLEARDSGFDDEHVLALQLTPPTHVYGPYQTGGQNPSRATLYRTLERAMAALPGVTSVSISGLMPLRHGVNPWGITIEGRGAPAEPLRDGTAVSNRQGRYHHGSIAIERVGPAYFHTLGIPLVRGRYIDERDDANGPLVTVVSETMAKKFFPGENPIGRRITADMTSYFPTLTIVGVVADNRMHGLDHDPYPLLYWSMSQFPSASAWLLVKARGPAGTFGPRVAAEIGRVAPDVPVSNVMTLNAARSESLWRQRFTAVMLGLFAIVALGLAAAGVYGVIAYSVSRRLREMAIRLALGANVSGILRLVVWSAVRPCLAGTVIGLGFYLAAKRLLDGQLVGVPATDPTILAAVSALPIAIGVIASFVPARRLLRRLDAAHALR
jgi:putative ABC transport system permease protein